VGPERRGKASPVKWFAGFGALVLTLQLYVYGRWLWAGPERTPTGEDTVPGWMATVARVGEVAAVIAWLAILYFVVIRPLLRRQQVSLTGRLVIVFLTLEWQDLLSNYFNHIYTWNAALTNFGSWYSYIPGWTSPRGDHLAEAVVFVIPMWTIGVLLPCVAIAAVMRGCKARWPHLRTAQLLLIAMGGGALVDVLVEPFFTRLGMYIFAGTIPSLTLWEGHYYQFPLYEPILLGACWAAFGCLIYFRDDRGLTVAERGIDSLRLRRRPAGAVRLLALVGFCNLVILLYNIVFAMISLLPSFRWAEDVVNRSYFRNEVCGAGTTFACPSDDVPIPRRGQPHVGPDGRLYPGE
jgi:hypothetical protein